MSETDRLGKGGMFRAMLKDGLPLVAIAFDPPVEKWAMFEAVAKTMVDMMLEDPVAGPECDCPLTPGNTHPTIFYDKVKCCTTTTERGSALIFVFAFRATPSLNSPLMVLLNAPPEDTDKKAMN